MIEELLFNNGFIGDMLYMTAFTVVVATCVYIFITKVMR